MAIRRIVKLGEDDVLRKHARKVDKFDRRLGILLDDMADTMYEADGVGLAAPQVTYVVQELRQRGIPISEDITTVAEAREAILELARSKDWSGRP